MLEVEIQQENEENNAYNEVQRNYKKMSISFEMLKEKHK